MFSIGGSGSFANFEKFLAKAKSDRILSILDGLGREGVAALQSGTPIDTGKTASSWSYEIEKTGNGYTISWLNSNTINGVNIAIIRQLGHGTGTGGWVQGYDYINPAMKPIFDKIADRGWKAVVSG